MRGPGVQNFGSRLEMIRTFSLVFFVFVSAAFSQVIETGGYRFELQVANEWGKEIENYRSSARIKNNRAFIKTRARGYRPTQTEVDLQEGQNDYSVDIELRDPWVDIELQSTGGEHIFSRMEKRGEDVSGDEFSFELTILEWDYKFFTPWDVEIQIENWPIYRAHVEVRGFGFGRIVEITFPRQELQYYSNDITVKIPKDGGLRQSREEKARTLRFQIQNKVESPHATGSELKKKLEDFQKLQ
jgi:hypothetical protein